MKKMLTTLIALLTCSSPVFAATAANSTDGGIFTILFLGFFTLIVVFQLVPATMMLIGMLKGLFSGKTQLHY